RPGMRWIGQTLPGPGTKWVSSRNRWRIKEIASTPRRELGGYQAGCPTDRPGRARLDQTSTMVLARESGQTILTAMRQPGLSWHESLASWLQPAESQTKVNAESRSLQLRRGSRSIARRKLAVEKMILSRMYATSLLQARPLIRNSWGLRLAKPPSTARSLFDKYSRTSSDAETPVRSGFLRHWASSGKA